MMHLLAILALAAVALVIALGIGSTIAEGFLEIARRLP